MSDPSLETWPALPLEAWKDTHDTLHMEVQIAGKVRLALAPMVNHWWQSTLYLTARGLTTSPMPYGNEAVQIDFDFFDHSIRVESSRGEWRAIPLAPRPVADFYADLMEALRSLGVEVNIWTKPVEVEHRIPFEQDHDHTAYDPLYAHRFWRVLLQSDRVMQAYRGRFCGKSSPVHFFFGSFDLNVSRFSGRKAPTMEKAYHVSVDVMKEAYSDEVISCGFWPGVGLGEPAYYAYTYPQPAGYPQYPVQPAAAYYHPTLKEFILPYEAVRTSGDPDETLMSFLQSTYEAGANLAQWDRANLESSYLIPEEKQE